MSSSESRKKTACWQILVLDDGVCLRCHHVLTETCTIIWPNANGHQLSHWNGDMVVRCILWIHTHHVQITCDFKRSRNVCHPALKLLLATWLTSKDSWMLAPTSSHFTSEMASKYTSPSFWHHRIRPDAEPVRPVT